MRLSTTTIAAVALATSFSGHLVAQSPSCWDPNLGVNLNLTDDSLAAVTLNFPFDMPGGGQTSAIDVSSNGFVWLVSGSSTSSGCCNGDPLQLATDPARIAPVWMDLNPTQGGAVYANSASNYATVTWFEVPEYGESGVNSVQLQLYQGGLFVIAIRALNVPGSHDLLVGCSPGGGAADPGEADLSTLPLQTNGVPTVYEHFVDPTDTRDLSGTAMLFQPDGGGGYIVIPLGPCANALPYGQGCPSEPLFYEQFGAGNDLAGTSYLCRQIGGGWVVAPCTTNCFEPNFQANLGLGDDALAPGLSLGFSFPLPGSAAGSTNAIDVCSNGFIWLVSGSSTSTDLSESVAEFLSDPERLAVFWDDLNPGAGGAVHALALPGKFVVTWELVPQYGNSDANTFQAQFFPNGDLILSYDANLNPAADFLAGYSPGNGVIDPGMVDMTSAPFSTGTGGIPLTHFLGGGVLPVLGTTINLAVDDVPATAIAGVVNMGVTRLALDLAIIQMPGCMLLNSAEITLPLALAAPTGTVPLPLPNVTSLMSIVLYSQSMVLAPGTTPLGAIASNGLELTLGM